MYTVADGQSTNETAKSRSEETIHTYNENISGISENFSRGQPVHPCVWIFIDRSHVADSSTTLGRFARLQRDGWRDWGLGQHSGGQWFHFRRPSLLAPPLLARSLVLCPVPENLRSQNICMRLQLNPWKSYFENTVPPNPRNRRPLKSISIRTVRTTKPDFGNHQLIPS